MPAVLSGERLKFLLNRLSDRLWVKPLVVCLISIGAAFIARLADGTALAQHVPVITPESNETLLSVMAASMLVIATFSVASMVSAYASASSTSTPRSFTLVVADETSQNALSTFIGAFIFSIVAMTAVKNAYFDAAGLFILFLLTVAVFAIVILTFVRWVDRIARLGRIGSTIDKVEEATASSLRRRRDAPMLGGMRIGKRGAGQPVFAVQVGYVQHIDMARVQAWAEQAGVRVVVEVLPGTFATPSRPLAHVVPASSDSVSDTTTLVESFDVGGERLFDDDPRFGLIVLSEIAGRALSPAVNDPGTAIDIVGTLVRLFAEYSGPAQHGSAQVTRYDRVEVPEIAIVDMFDDAFTAIARDGAGVVEVAIRLQKALETLASLGHEEMRAAAIQQSRLALKRARLAMDLPEDVAVVEEAARFSAPVEPQP